jgi:hypothetical protein
MLTLGHPMIPENTPSGTEIVCIDDEIRGDNDGTGFDPILHLKKGQSINLAYFAQDARLPHLLLCVLSEQTRYRAVDTGLHFGWSHTMFRLLSIPNCLTELLTNVDKRIEETVI